MPTLNLIDPETMQTFLDMMIVAREFQSLTSFRIIIFISQEFLTLAILTGLLYADMFDLIDIYHQSRWLYIFVVCWWTCLVYHVFFFIYPMVNLNQV